MFNDIDSALEWLMQRRNETKSFATFKHLMEKLGNPQDDLKLIHVAGTNGKGSTVTFLSDLLIAHGYRVGTLQSPHFLSHLDRIRVNGKNIPSATFLTLLNANYAFFIEHNLNMFEIDFIIMSLYFRQLKLDYVVVEVGIGGRLDSTNVINHPLLSIIVTIGYDHMDRLGNTLEQICIEKCGIVKPSSILLVGDLLPELKKLCQDVAQAKDCKYYELGAYQKIGSRSFIYAGQQYQIASFADYQLHNAALALKAYQILVENYQLDYDEDKVRMALANSIWRGRFEIIKEHPRVILDGAHNIDGIIALANSVKQLDGSKAILFAALKTKEYQKMLAVLNSVFDRVVLTSFNHPLACHLEDYGEGEYMADFTKAYQILCDNFDNIVVAGSLYFISDFVQVMLK